MKRVGVVALVAALLVVSVPVASRAGGTREVRIASVAPRGSSWAKLFDRFAREVSAGTGGRVTVKLFLGGVQGDEKDYVRKMSLGQLDGAAVTLTGLSMVRPEVWALSVPMMFRSDREVDHVRARLVPELDRAFDKAGYVILAWGDVGWEHIYTNVPLRTLADLKRTKMWVWGGEENWVAFWRRLGVNNVPLGLPDVLPSLQTGLIDACYGPPLAAVAFQWYTKVRYATTVPIDYFVGAVLLRRDVLDKLSAEDRQVVIQAGKRASVEVVKQVRRDNLRARHAMERAGVKFMDPGPELVKAFEEAGRGAAEDMVKQKLFDADLLARVKAYVAEVRR